MNKILWVDLETTGLDVSTCRILEVAAVITTQDLRVIGTFTACVHTAKYYLDHMNEWCMKQHTQSGLVNECQDSPFSLSDIDGRLSKFIAKHISKDAVLYGNTITFDQQFIKAKMKKTAALLHYRTVDVTAFKKYFTDRYDIPLFPKLDTHRAVDDILASIAELEYYSKFIRIEQ